MCLNSDRKHSFKNHSHWGMIKSSDMQRKTSFWECKLISLITVFCFFFFGSEFLKRIPYGTTKYRQTTPVQSSGNLSKGCSQCPCSWNLCSQSTLSQTAAILSNLFLSAAAWEYWNITWIAAMSRLILQWQNALVFATSLALQRCLVSKNLFFYPLENPNIHKNALQSQARDLRGGHEHGLATTDSLLKHEISLYTVPGLSYS